MVGQEVLGRPIHDNWWQTETGGIMIANLPALDIKPGSMGKPRRPASRRPSCVRAKAAAWSPSIDAPDQEGELALRRGWPSMLRGYLNNESALPQVLRRRLVPDRRPGGGATPTVTTGLSVAATT